MNRDTIAAFAVGVSVGIGVSYFVLKKKYDAIINKEIQDFREARKNMKEHSSCENNMCDPDEDPIEVETKMDSYKNIVDSLKYTASGVDKARQKYNLSGADFDGDKIAEPPTHVITLDEFGTVPLYDTDSFYCYEDGTITTCDNDLVEDVESILGLKGTSIYELYETGDNCNTVCVRNHHLKCDYEILREIGEYNS